VIGVSHVRQRGAPTSIRRARNKTLCRSFQAAPQAGQVVLCGNRAKLVELLGLLDAPAEMFAVVEPRP
jgi:alkyl sulfatase BDS1-like metallo-beta-lactamase superfamily hydrolase